MKEQERANQVPATVATHPAWKAARRAPYRFALVARDLLAAGKLMEATGDAAPWTRALSAAKEAGLQW